MNLDRLKYFCDVVRLGSVRAAAELNHVTSPAVSHAVRSLGDSLGVELFVHGKNRLEITPQGELLYHESLGLLEEFERIRGYVLNSTHVPQGTLRIAASAFLTQVLLDKCLKSFSQKFPQVEIHLSLCNARILRNRLHDRVCEVGIAVDDGNFSAFSQTILYEGAFVCVQKQGERQPMSEETRFIVGDLGPEVEAFRSFAHSHWGNEFRPAMTVSSWTVMAELVSQGMGVGYLPDLVLRGTKKAQFSCCEYGVPKFPYRICAYWLSRGALSRNAKLWLDELSF